jgi:hypothetical protein
VKHKTFRDFITAHRDRYMPHQVAWVAGGMIDERYFEDADDARWFFSEGWNSSDFVEDGSGAHVGYGPNALWVDGKLEGDEEKLTVALQCELQFNKVEDDE